MDISLRYFALSIVLLLSSIVHADDFVVCKSTYALCTTARCTPLNEGGKELANCTCDVKTGLSASEKPCKKPKKTAAGIEIFSRYYPVQAYITCSNSRPWAFCLDVPCTVDAKDPKKAICQCTMVKNKGDYVVVTDNQVNINCTSDIISSATVDQITSITKYLNDTEQLQPYTIKSKE